MTLEINGGRAVLSGVCTVEEALDLHEYLRAAPTPAVDLSDCTYLHTALWQLLVGARAQIVRMPEHDVLGQWLPKMLNQPNSGWIAVEQRWPDDSGPVKLA